MKKKILFIGHSAGRGGASILLLNFLKWFKDNVDIPFEIILIDGGELIGEYQKLTDVVIFPKKETLPQKILRNLFRKPSFGKFLLGLRMKAMINRINQEELGLIYSNTITSGILLKAFSGINCPVITHVHELEYWLKNRTEPDSVKAAISKSDHFIGVSDAAIRNLVDNHGIKEEKCSRVYGFIPLAGYSGEQIKKTREQIREYLDIPQDAFVVCGSGSMDWLKGIDLFVQIMAIVNKNCLENKAFFLWVGGNKKSVLYNQIMHDVNTINMSDYFKITGEVTNPLDYYCAADVFSLTSREESLSLVTLEAASIGLPIVCFENAGGAVELVEQDMGFCIPYLDLVNFSEKLNQLKDFPDLRQKIGDAARKKVEENFSLVNGAPKLLQIIQKFYLD